MEDLLLSRAFVSASEDPVVGKSQSGADFREKIARCYVEFVNFQNKENQKANKLLPPRHRMMDAYATDRTVQSLWNRFSSKISPAVTKFVSITATLPKDSGTNEDDFLRSCCAMWNETAGQSKNLKGINFESQLLECYEFLKNSPKWKMYTDTKSSARASSTTNNAKGDDNGTPSNTENRKRPPGTKAARKANKALETADAIMAKLNEKDENEQSKKDTDGLNELKGMFSNLTEEMKAGREEMAAGRKDKKFRVLLANASTPIRRKVADMELQKMLAEESSTVPIRLFNDGDGDGDGDGTANNNNTKDNDNNDVSSHHPNNPC
eukprot:CAMPEP_0196823334 /NCGR_PEP_ID=MMETSP1362-20130617/87016_1 /TAXON_ID=163516 /ORGANISM="Leptocylindrus danicus, Strain CCMP1856" /LENGTH=322 /DNA_ID=CAMNT_0042203167 /DNA_START=57 /DNA_END=1025 /DNA_ORIENTATION=-